MFSIFSS